MRVLLDGQLLNISQPTFAEAIDAVAEAAVDRGRLVGDVVADGIRLTDEQIEEAATGGATYSELVCTSIDPIEIVVSTLRDAVDAVESAARDQQTAAELLQAGKTQEALETLGPVFATWQVVQMVVDRGGAAVEMDFRTVAIPGIDEPRPVERCAATLMNSLVELKRALADEDWSALSDIVGFDLDAQARDWRNVLGGLAELVESRRPGGGGT